jgi:hypothetical protein
MKVYKLEIIIIDFDRLGEDGIKDAIHAQRWPNDCIDPYVYSTQSAEIGEWTDDNPLNRRDTYNAEVKRLFGD